MTTWQQFESSFTFSDEPELELWRGYRASEWSRIGAVVDDSFPDLVSTPLARRWLEEDDKEVTADDVRRGIGQQLCALGVNCSLYEATHPKTHSGHHAMATYDKIDFFATQLNVALASAPLGFSDDVTDATLAALSAKAIQYRKREASIMRSGRPRLILRDIYWRGLVWVWRDELGGKGTGRGKSVENTPKSRLIEFIAACSSPVLGGDQASVQRVDDFLRKPYIRNNSDQIF